ncbi:hypothetical protein [Salmonirosea aquatica]|uniref:Uncharacterized protein n=1 Tax=Salmonirosea aquatica TaxID=2654236 RepID=A0A7C9BMN2_9BACT|nr:hypothetical protein [Cytophagaceae bacterium SJW1-29]
MSQLAKEQVSAHMVRNKDLFVFGSKGACLRIIDFFHTQHKYATLSFAIDPWYIHYVTVFDYE